jgi:plasmid stability protein
MTTLLVRNLDDALVQSLRELAASHGRSAEAEHRAILAEALQRPKRRSFAEVLSQMPDVGLDEDFARVSENGEPAHVFD